ncbi:MAG TPA: thiamine phosphate synthase [Acidimicrobiales bacterium]|nr:thiamine phosphate synthase [Acidimicrobiales bacterium]
MIRAAIGGRSLYLCTSNRDHLLDFVSACVAGGVDVVQLREKHLEARDLLRVGAELARCCADLGVPFIVNDRPDLALELDADGVHVGQDDAPPALARRILGPDKIIGLSTHAPDELGSGVLEPVDYLAAGPVVATPTKPSREGTGVGYIETAVRATDGAAGGPVPLFITGGVTPSAITRLAAAGARRFVVERYLTEAPDPRVAAGELRRAIDEAVERRSS